MLVVGDDQPVSQNASLAQLDRKCIGLLGRSMSRRGNQGNKSKITSNIQKPVTRLNVIWNSVV